jgi:hypothetical protein
MRLGSLLKLNPVGVKKSANQKTGERNTTFQE